MPLKIKISTPISDQTFPVERQLPKGNAKFSGIEFFINQEVEECDYWFVYENVAAVESCRCNPKNVILITGEPPAIKNYNKQFTDQFGQVMTCHSKLKHANKILTFPPLLWLVGVKYDRTEKKWRNRDYLAYNDFKTSGFENKTKELSIISSKKGFTPGHRKRLAFIEEVQEYFGDKVDVFGRGFIEIEDKISALADYRFTIVLENSNSKDYWSEKLADAFLCNCFPFYSGCTNIYDYFSKNSLTVIDVNKPMESLRLIDKLLNSNVDVERKEFVQQAKEKILDDYNLFFQIQKKVDLNDFLLGKEQVVINPISYSLVDRIKNRFLRL
jgi:hypothetical protein